MAREMTIVCLEKGEWEPGLTADQHGCDRAMHAVGGLDLNRESPLTYVDIELGPGSSGPVLTRTESLAMKLLTGFCKIKETE